MQIVRTIAEMRRAVKGFRRADPDAVMGLVPTMGALHAGHRSLVRAARARCGWVAATIFVNPTQFGPHEDLGRYPRTWEADSDMLQAEGADVLFAPTPDEMYPVGAETWVEAPGVGGRLDGASRPGHFRGVATVVTKLFHIVQPDLAFFGQKDAAQVAMLRTMVRDLNFDVEIVVCPTVRDPDGLALSSRNRYLSAPERAMALGISRALDGVRQCAVAGQHDAKALQAGLLRALEQEGGVRVDYAELVDPATLEPVADVRQGALVAVAAWVGTTRLIDNVVLPALAERESK